MDFLLVLIELFTLGVTADALRAKIDGSRLFRSNAVTLIQNFRYKGSPPPIIFAWLVRLINALYNFIADSFHTGVTAKAIRTKIDRKPAISLQRGHFDPKFQLQGVAPHQSFLHG